MLPEYYFFLAGHTEVVSHLVNKCNRSVDLDARNALGFTPLMKAALQGRTKIAKILLFAGGWTQIAGHLYIKFKYSPKSYCHSSL